MVMTCWLCSLAYSVLLPITVIVTLIWLSVRGALKVNVALPFKSVIAEVAERLPPSSDSVRSTLLTGSPKLSVTVTIMVDASCELIIAGLAFTWIMSGGRTFKYS